MSEQRAVPEIPEDLSATHSAAAADLNGWMRFTGAETVAMIERIATLTAERDALQATLRQGADSDEDLRTKYEALKLERDGLAQKLADSELAFNHANEVVGKLEADVATHQQHYVDLECLFEKCVSERDGLKATVERVTMSEKVMAAELQAMERRKDAQIAELNRRIEVLSAPVTDEEIEEHGFGATSLIPRTRVNAIIAARTSPAKETK